MPKTQFLAAEIPQLDCNAKRLSRETGIPDELARDCLALRHGYANWLELTQSCIQEESGAPGGTVIPVDPNAPHGIEVVVHHLGSMPQMQVSHEESTLLEAIFKRYHDLVGDKYSSHALIFSVVGCHCNGCPLGLAALLEAPDEAFLYDLDGLQRHTNLSTGHLDGVFTPRYALENLNTSTRMH